MLSTNNIFGEEISECINLLSTDELQLPSNIQKVSSTENRRNYINENINKNLIKEEEKVSSADKGLKSSISTNNIKIKIKNKNYLIKKVINKLRMK